MKQPTIILVFIFVLLAGCFSKAPVARVPDYDTSRTLSLQDFANRYDLQLLSRPGSDRYVLSKRGKKLIVYPGLSVFNYDGKVYTAPSMPYLGRGQVLFPQDFIDSLPGDITRERLAVSSALPVVVIDAGHGGKDPGATSCGLREKDITLDIALKLRDILSATGYKTQMTRNGDYFISLGKRSQIVNRYPGALFISIHANSEESGEADGIETYWLSSKVSDNSRAGKASNRYLFSVNGRRMSRSGSKEYARKLSAKARKSSRRLASSVQKSLIASMGEKDRGVKQANFAVLRESYFGPSILVEIGFISDKATACRMVDHNYRKRIARSIADGVISYNSFSSF